MSVMDESCELLRAAEELVQGFDVEPRRCFGGAGRRPVAAVRPVRRTATDACGDRVAEGVQDGPNQVRVARDVLREGPILEEVRFPAVAAIRAARVIAV